MRLDSGKREAAARRRTVAPFLVTLALATAAAAQPPASPVGFTEAITHDVRPTLDLTGSVESRSASLIAAEVAGLVVELAAREGDHVVKGRPVVKLRRDTAELRLRAAEGRLKEAQARRRLAESKRSRSLQLFDEKVISQDQLDDALSEFDASDGRVAELEADVERLRDDLERTAVRAPFSSVVVAEHTAVGEWVAAGDPVAELLALDDLEITLEVPESFYDGLMVGGAVTIRVAALGGDEVEGRVRAVVPRADPRARTFPVKISLPNEDGRIGVGMLAQVFMPLGKLRATTMVPKDALLSQGSSARLFVIGEGDKVRPVQVKSGSSSGVWIGVEGQIAAGDRVVTQGNERLMPGQAVLPEPAEYPRP